MIMKVNVFDLSGKVAGKVELPKTFSENFRPDLIIRAFLASRSKKRQPYGANPQAGLRTSVHYHGKRRYRYTMMMRDMARLPRMHGTSPHLTWRVRRVPQAVKGRRAHPPKAEKIWEQKINKKEMKLAMKSAIAAMSNKDMVLGRGHKVSEIKELPIVIKDIEKIKKSKEMQELLINVGLNDELKRAKPKKVRAGRGKTRGRKYKRKIGPLVVVDKEDSRGGRNLAGVDVRTVDKLSIDDLAPGAIPGRVSVWSKTALEKVGGIYG